MASNEFLFNILAKLGKAGKKPSDKSAKDWFRDSVSKMASPKSTDVTSGLKKIGRLKVNNVGQLFLFFYNPKHKTTLPYYDRFPCVFPIQMYPDGFLGINLHYLPPYYRAQLMSALWKTDNMKTDEKRKLRITYRILQSASKFSLFQPCVKRYLYTQVQSAFFVIPVDEWDLVCMLPTEKFVGASKNQVWIDSMNKIGARY